MTLTAEQANELLRTNPQAYTTAESLRELITQLDISGRGSKTLLYSGDIANNLSAQGTVLEIAANNSDIRIIDHTEANEFLDYKTNPDLVNALENIFGIEEKPGTRGSDANRFLFEVEYDGQPGAWASTSKRFAALAEGAVDTFT